MSGMPTNATKAGRISPPETVSAAELQPAPDRKESLPETVVCAVLMPHAPVLIPGVSTHGESPVAASQHAMRTAATLLLRHRPDGIVLISPHSPRRSRAFGIWTDSRVSGSLACFNAPHAEINLPLDLAMARAIALEAGARNLETWSISSHPLDHGALVPLWFLAEAGWDGPTVVLSLHFSKYDGIVLFGEAIAAAADALSHRIAIVASGDMSHSHACRPAGGDHPRANSFDEAFLTLVGSGDYRALRHIPESLRETASEDAIDPTLIATAAAGWRSNGHKLLCYEAPLGVGYGTALLFSESSLPDADAVSFGKSGGRLLPSIARHAIESAVAGSVEPPPPPFDDYTSEKHGVFVALRKRDGSLRGFAGSPEPVTPNIVFEVWRNARLAAKSDARFHPVSADEVAGLLLEVSVVHSIEKVSSPEELDPAVYGVVVSTGDGRKGLLLPGSKAITTVDDQLRLARQKGSIQPGEPATVLRFQVDLFEDPIIEVTKDSSAPQDLIHPSLP